MSGLSEARVEALAEVLRPAYLSLISAEHEANPSCCGGECFRESDIRLGLAQWTAALAPLVAGWIAEERAAIAREIEALPTTRTKAWDKGWDSVSLADVLSIARGDS